MFVSLVRTLIDNAFWPEPNSNLKMLFTLSVKCPHKNGIWTKFVHTSIDIHTHTHTLFSCMFLFLSPQDVEEDVAMGTDAGPAAKLCKTESQTHMSPRYKHTHFRSSVSSSTLVYIEHVQVGTQTDFYCWIQNDLWCSCCLHCCWLTWRFQGLGVDQRQKSAFCRICWCVWSVRQARSPQMLISNHLSVCSLCSKTGSQMSRHQWSISMKDRQNSRGTDRTSSMDSETSSDYRIPPPQVRLRGNSSAAVNSEVKWSSRLLSQHPVFNKTFELLAAAPFVSEQRGFKPHFTLLTFDPVLISSNV